MPQVTRESETTEHVWLVTAHGVGVDRCADSLETGMALCEDALNTLSLDHPATQTWTRVAGDGEPIWVRYYQSVRWENGEAHPASVEQRVVRRPIDTTGKWFGDDGSAA